MRGLQGAAPSGSRVSFACSEYHCEALLALALASYAEGSYSPSFHAPQGVALFLPRASAKLWAIKL
ncbi:hypothetical protein [Sorangium sp. So ce1151]|uniref:hypothetical protein n=1 Tax=Sorangium sp. So ce1151 TaxID=3133332 RepID=UPI003F639F44